MIIVDNFIILFRNNEFSFKSFFKIFFIQVLIGFFFAICLYSLIYFNIYITLFGYVLDIFTWVNHHWQIFLIKLNITGSYIRIGITFMNQFWIFLYTCCILGLEKFVLYFTDSIEVINYFQKLRNSTYFISRRMSFWESRPQSKLLLELYSWIDTILFNLLNPSDARQFGKEKIVYLNKLSFKTIIIFLFKALIALFEYIVFFILKIIAYLFSFIPIKIKLTTISYSINLIKVILIIIVYLYLLLFVLLIIGVICAKYNYTNKLLNFFKLIKFYFNYLIIWLKSTK